MELLHGETLQQRLRRGPIDLPALLDIAIPLTDGLHAAHAAGIVHRDLKPANIFLSEGGPKILDFGVARADPSATAPASASETRLVLTESGTTIGTVAYMSPEQLRGERVDAQIRSVLPGPGPLRNGDWTFAVHGHHHGRNWWCRFSMRRRYRREVCAPTCQTPSTSWYSRHWRKTAISAIRVPQIFAPICTVRGVQLTRRPMNPPTQQ